MKMPIRAVILDVGGVLVHQRGHDERLEWETRLGLPQEGLTRLVFDSPWAARAASGEVSEPDVWKQVGGQLGLRDDQLPELQRDFWAGEQLDTELVQFIQSLRPRYKIGIISNAWSDVRHFHNSKFKMNTWTDVVIYSAEVKLVKPDPRIYQLALERLGVKPEEAVFVDDVLVNVEAARALGIWGVQFQNTAQTINAVKGHLNEHST
jgi:epoxide hydrolase-like predicted phosphatase